ncbi:MAG: hypothetical protein FWF92_03415 [Oscillospiraceae bacterium]|nr:hypothetical protein [Oscillospiraceae bacterium]
MNYEINNIGDILECFDILNSDEKYVEIIKHIYVKAENELSATKIIFPNYTDHTINHSKKVLGYVYAVLNQTLGKSTDTSKNKSLDLKTGLNINETFILICAILLHDIAMATAYDKNGKEKPLYVTKITDEERNYIRDNHAKLGEKKIKKEARQWFKNFGSPIFTGFIASVVSNHTQNITLIHDETALNIRLKLLSALLKLGDALHITKDRADINDLNSFLIENDSVFHWGLVHFVESITINKFDFFVKFRFYDDTNNSERIKKKVSYDVLKNLRANKNNNNENNILYVLRNYGIPIEIDFYTTEDSKIIDDISNSAKEMLNNVLNEKLKFVAPPPFKTYSKIRDESNNSNILGGN